MAEMIRDENSIRVLEEMLVRINYTLRDTEQIAIMKAIVALRQPGWISTSDRRMTLADADDDGCLPVIVRCKKTKEVRRAHQHVYDKFDLMGWECLAFLPLPPMPEVEG